MAEKQVRHGTGKHCNLLCHYCGSIFRGAIKSCSNFADLRRPGRAAPIEVGRSAGCGERFHGSRSRPFFATIYCVPPSLPLAGRHVARIMLPLCAVEARRRGRNRSLEDTSLPANARLARLADNPFARLGELLHGITPRANEPPILMSVGEPQHAPPPLLARIV